MSQVKLSIIDENSDLSLIGLFDLDVIPRVGEFVSHESEGEDPRSYKVTNILHYTDGKTPIEIWVETID